MRVVKVTDTRTKEDFAYFVEELVYVHFHDAICIQLVLDNLNTHFEGSLLETFGVRKATKLLKRVKFIYTPKHGSWLNIAEIEINAMDRQCTGGRIENKKRLEAEDLAHLVALEAFLDHGEQGLERAELEQIGRYPDHR